MTKISEYLIYGLTDPTTNTIRYIGKSSSGLKRPTSHTSPYSLKIRSLKTNWILSLIKKNAKPKIIIIEECASESVLNEREVFWIKLCKTGGCRLTNGTDGGNGGNTGGAYKKHKPIISINIMTGTKKRYDFIWQTEPDGFNPSRVCAVCKKKRKSHRGYFFYYESEKISLYRPPAVKKRIKSICKRTQIEYNFPSIKEASITLQISITTISKTLHGYLKGRHYDFKLMNEPIVVEL